MLHVELISADASVLTLCREIAREAPVTTWHLRSRREFDGDSKADLIIWDYYPGNTVPEHLSWGTKCFVLVASSDVAEFRATRYYAEPGIILKPVTRAVLRAVFTQRIRQPEKAQHRREMLRADRDELLQCLMQANLQLQEFEANRSNFLGRVLHDFHAPLTALTGYCGMLLAETSGALTDQQKVILSRMHRSVRRLSRMSRAMFQLSVGSKVNVQPTLRWEDIGRCVTQAVYEIQPLLQEKQLEINVKLQSLSTPLLIDPDQIEQVIINLLENACKFSPPGGSILVNGYSCFCERRARNIVYPAGAERRESDRSPMNSYRVDIADSGPGVSPDQLKSIFEEYVSYATADEPSRGGLGLAICRTILDQHQGRIWAENCSSGAVFSFILPCRPGSSPTGVAVGAKG